MFYNLFYKCHFGKTFVKHTSPNTPISTIFDFMQNLRSSLYLSAFARKIRHFAIFTKVTPEGKLLGA